MESKGFSSFYFFSTTLTHLFSLLSTTLGATLRSRESETVILTAGSASQRRRALDGKIEAKQNKQKQNRDAMFFRFCYSDTINTKYNYYLDLFAATVCNILLSFDQPQNYSVINLYL